MIALLKPFLRTAAVLGALVWLLPTVTASSTTAVVLASIILTILYSGIRPVLKIVFLPFTIVTFGFFSIVINVALLWLMTYLVPSFQVLPMEILGVGLNMFSSYVVISFLISFLHWLISKII